jgi:hypothetical protein
VEISSVIFIHLLDLIRSEKCNYRAEPGGPAIPVKRSNQLSYRVFFGFYLAFAN